MKVKLNKKELRYNKAAFVFAWVMILIGLVLASYILDFTKETVEIETTVTHTWYSKSGRKMNVEWYDLNGERQVEGSLANGAGYEAGDTYILLVDAETQSRMTPSKGVSILLFVIGMVFALPGVGVIKTYFYIEKDEESKNN